MGADRFVGLVRLGRMGLLLFALLASVALAQSPVLMQGKDSNGVIRTLRVDTSGQALLSNTQSTIASTSSNQSTTLSASGTACTAAGGASCTVLIGPIDLSTWTNVTISLSNDGANALTNCLIEWSPDGARYEVWDSTTFAALGSGAKLSLAFSGNSRRYLRIEGRSASGTTIQVNLNMNAG